MAFILILFNEQRFVQKLQATFKEFQLAHYEILEQLMADGFSHAG